MSATFVLEALVVLLCIVMGTRSGGVGVGLWGGLGVGVLVFVFGEQPGDPPASAIAIILAVVTAASMMQAAGGIDWMVSVAAKVIERHPKQITLIAPLTAFLFSVGAVTEGTDAQAKTTVRLEENGKMVDGQGADTDTIVSAARAYVHALNKLIVKRERTEPAALNA